MLNPGKVILSLALAALAAPSLLAQNEAKEGALVLKAMEVADDSR